MGVGIGWKYKRKPRGPIKKKPVKRKPVKRKPVKRKPVKRKPVKRKVKRKPVKLKPATRRKRAQIRADIMEGIFSSVCEPAFDFPCRQNVVINRDGTVDGEMYIEALGDPEDVLLHLWDAMAMWFPEGKSIWISIVFWMMAPKWSESPKIREYLEEHDNKPPGGVVPIPTHFRIRRNPDHPGNFMQQVFDTARFNVLWRLQSEGYHIKNISVRLHWNPDNEKP